MHCLLMLLIPFEIYNPFVALYRFEMPIFPVTQTHVTSPFAVHLGSHLPRSRILRRVTRHLNLIFDVLSTAFHISHPYFTP